MSFHSYKSEKSLQTSNIYSSHVPLLNSEKNAFETKAEIFNLPYPHFPINLKDG